MPARSSPGGQRHRRARFSGDIVTVVADRRWSSFMRSYPNIIPLSVATVRRIAEKLEPYDFDRVYGGWRGNRRPRRRQERGTPLGRAV